MGRVLTDSSSREIKKALSTAVDEFESLYPDKLPPLIDLVCWHADIPTFLIREARSLIKRRRRNEDSTDAHESGEVG